MPNMINMPSPVEAERAGWPLPITDRVISALSAWAVQVLSKDVLGQSFLFFFSLAASLVEGFPQRGGVHWLAALLAPPRLVPLSLTT